MLLGLLWTPAGHRSCISPGHAGTAPQPQTPSPASPSTKHRVPKGRARCPQAWMGPSGFEPCVPEPRVPRHRARHPSALWPPSSASPSPKPHGPKPGVPKHQARCPEQVFCPQTPRPRPQHWNTLSRGQLRVGSPHRGHQHGVDTGCGDPSGATPRPLCPRSPSRGAGTHRDGGRRWEPAAL